LQELAWEFSEEAEKLRYIPRGTNTEKRMEAALWCKVDSGGKFFAESEGQGLMY